MKIKEEYRLLKMLKRDIMMTTVFFKADDEFYDVCFEKNIFGKITNVSIIKGKRGEPLTGYKNISVVCTSPQNILSRIKLMSITFKDFLKQIFRHQ